jgi:hypothetical protein
MDGMVGWGKKLEQKRKLEVFISYPISLKARGRCFVRTLWCEP